MHAVDDEVQVDELDVISCRSIGGSQLKFLYFSAKGVVRLHMSNIPFVKISYNFLTPLTGNRGDLYHNKNFK